MTSTSPLSVSPLKCHPSSIRGLKPPKPALRMAESPGMRFAVIMGSPAQKQKPPKGYGGPSQACCYVYPLETFVHIPSRRTGFIFRGLSNELRKIQRIAFFGEDVYMLYVSKMTNHSIFRLCLRTLDDLKFCRDAI